MNTSVTQKTIQWKQVWSLVALDVAIIISWIAYHKYQPKLLEQFDFTQFALILAIVQGIILFLTPPIAGRVADNIRIKNGSRLPVINVGINFVSMVFMVVAVTIFANPSGWIRFLFPVMVVLWLISMNIFHSPAISTVELFVPPQKLPEVMAIFVVIADLTQAIEPSIIDIIEVVGAPITFALGGSLVFLTGYFLQSTTKNLSANQSNVEAYENVEKSNFILVFALGLMVGLATSVFFEIFPQLTQAKLTFISEDGFKGSYFTSLLIAISALISYPISRQVQKLNLKSFAFLGFSGILILSCIIYFSPQSEITIIPFLLYPFVFAILTVSALPIAFMRLKPIHKVLGIGIFFSGLELPNSIAEVLQVLGYL